MTSAKLFAWRSAGSVLISDYAILRARLCALRDPLRLEAFYRNGRQESQSSGERPIFTKS
jgi:hypothetical protein